jgi:hypothetical protein
MVFHLSAPFGDPAADDAYEIERALLFDGGSYLSWTPASAGNRKTWTWSAWVKRAELGTEQMLFGCHTSTSDAATLDINFSSSDRLRVNGWSNTWRETTAVFRDVSAWLHILVVLDTTQATSGDRVKIFINGELITSFITSNAPSLNADLGVGQASEHALGRDDRTGSSYFKGYFTPPYFIDGQALTADDFGEINPDTGQWVPKRYTGTYGANGFYLPFDNNASTTTLGEDASGNGNDWTLTGFTTDDSVIDTPTDNFAVLNPLDIVAGTLSEANLKYVSGGTRSAQSSVFFDSGKHVAEATLDGGTQTTVGIVSAPWATGSAGFTYPGDTATGRVSIGYLQDGRKGVNGSFTAFGATYTTGDVIRVEVDVDAGEVEFFKNNVSQGVLSFTPGSAIAFSSGGYGAGGGNWTWNFGQKPFAHTATAGFKALSTKNLPDPLIANPKLYFDTLLYEGDGSTVDRSINGVDFQADFGWFKNRDAAASHVAIDSSRAGFPSLFPDLANAEVDEDEFVSFNADGVTLKRNASFDRLNSSASSYVAWLWKKGVTPGFDIVAYTGDGVAGRTVAHGLGDAPAMMIIKNRNAAGNAWAVYHRAMASDPETDFLLLNSTDAVADSAALWNDTAPTSSVFTLGAGGAVNESAARTYIAYLFAEVPGFSAFGSYVGNGSADGPYIHLGFRPAFWGVKAVSVGGNSWTIEDAVRSPNNPSDKFLYANLSNAENAGTPRTDLLSGGVKIRDTNNNTSGVTYIYWAFAQAPFKFANAA